MTNRSRSGPSLALITILFTFSGGVGLLYEVAWVRRLTLVFGNTTYAASATLAIFFLGLAVGAALAARLGSRLQRSLRTYGLLEIGLGLYAAATPWMFEASLPIYRAVYRGAPDDMTVLLAVQAILCALVLGPPTCAMGATLPVLSQGLARRSDQLSARIGWLYGWNTAGAATGTMITGFLLLGTIGVNNTIWLGATVSVIVGLLALALGRTEPRLESALMVEPEATVPEPEEREAPARLVLGVMAASGALGLGYEILWTRLSVYALGTTAYAFAVMLVTYLVGLAFGDLIASRFLRRRRARLHHLAWTQVGIGLASALSLWGLLQLPELNRAWNDSPLLTTAAGYYTFRFGQSFLVMLLPTLFLGATFPIAIDLLAPDRHRTSRVVGRLYAWNTIGGVCGSILAGFMLIPSMGTVGLLRAGVAVNALLAAALVVPRLAARRTAVGVGALATVAVAVVALHRVSLVPILTASEFGSVVVYQDEGITGTVTIHEYPETDVRVLSINGTNVAGTTLPLITTQKIQGHIPALLHGNPRTAMQIGFGSGETAKVLQLHGVETIHGVEISPEVIKAGDHLAELNGGVAYSEEFRPIIMDAVNYARLTDRTYDLILNDSIFPGLAGSSALYTHDHFAACASHLNPGGIFSCWLPLDVTPYTFGMIIRSLNDVFPYTQLWVAANCDNKNALLVGSFEPIAIALPAWERTLKRPAVGRDLHSIRIADAPILASYLLLDSAGMRAVAEGAPLNTHDHPRLEYAPFSSQGYHSRWAENLAEMRRHEPDFQAILTAEVGQRPDLLRDLAQAQTANRIFLAGQLQDLRGQGPAARSLYEQALAVQPGHRGAQYALAKLDDRAARAERMVPADTRDPADLRRLADVFWRCGLPGKAVPVLERLLSIQPDAAAQELLVVCALATGQVEAAAAHIDGVLARHPNDPTWRYNAALIAQQRGRSDEAAAAYTQLLTDAPTYRPARFALAKLHIEQNQFADAEQVLEHDPSAANDPEWHHLLALAYAGQGRTGEARAHVERALALNPGLAQARRLAEMLAQSP